MPLKASDSPGDLSRCTREASSAEFRVLPLDRRHNLAMLKILRESPIVAGGLSICFDRQPDIFLMSELKYGPPVWGGFFEGDELAGFALMGIHDAYVNGRIARVMHIANCYIRPQSRGRGYLRASLPFFLNELQPDISIGYAVVMKGNRAAESQLGDKMAGAPWHLRSRKIAELSANNIFLGLHRRRKPGHEVRTARLDDIDDIVELLRAEHSCRLFGLVTDRDRFAAALTIRPGLSIDNYYVIEKRGKLVAVCAAWDTCAFKQNKVLRYGFRLGAVRAANNLLSLFAGNPSLPKAGESFQDIVITDWAVRERSVEWMHSLLEHIYNNYSGGEYHSMIFGSCAEDPILQATRGFVRTQVVSDIALFSLGERHLEQPGISTSLPFIDIAFL